MTDAPDNNSPAVGSENYPLVETILGFQFEPVQEFRSAHHGLFWEHIGRDKWPICNEKQASLPQREMFSEPPWLSSILSLQVSQKPEVRTLFFSSEKDRAIQIQNGQLLYNWRKTSGPVYPRFEKLKSEFMGFVDSLFEFFKVENFITKITQWEFSYVNHVEKGTAWKDKTGWGNVFGHMSGLTEVSDDVAIDGVASEWHYEIKPEIGRVHASIRNGKIGDTESAKEVLLLHLTGRGSLNLDVEKRSDLLKSLELGHDAVVKVFKKLATTKALKEWGIDP
ncbi:MAG: TIGR04255 family protein [Planctomycetes bacterium]|nr:TIGR04255 family protein [Planctomycetota bacterium]